MNPALPAGVRIATHGGTLPADLAAAVDAGLDAHNQAAAPLHEVQPLMCSAHAADGTLLGGAVGRTWGACAELQELWVAPAQRRQGLGAALVRAFEAAAAARGCSRFYLVTLSFQATRLYAALGYVRTQAVDGYAPGVVKHWLHKRAPAVVPAAAPLALPGVRVREVTQAEPGLAPRLGALLRDAVDGGASVGFLADLDDAAATAWAAECLAALGPGLALWVAEADDGALLGSVQLGPCGKPNGRHRGEVMKLLVQRTARGRRIASALLAALEAGAVARGLTLLVLDTESGSLAETVYRRHGWQHAGDIPDYAGVPDGRLIATALFYKRLAPG